ncbi:hypothetical protein SteCoe_20711 [Stentor coeruleus]|uniref:Macro domain-containing protein n=1 Tax=Stentor coeruleus TaxID=5963 RepID=A0A1R2BRC5_9CILI|nr:hypothetical protein SteCoe_20711 [Stentor coeruleus]
MSSEIPLIASALINNVLIRLYFGSALNLHAEAVVNAANEELEHGGGIAGQIAKEAGEKIREESRNWIAENGRIILGGVASTNPLNLRVKGFKCIIHAVGPKEKGSYLNEDMLISTLVNSIKEASIKECNSVNIPGISCGIFGFPKDVSAQCHFKAFIIFASQTEYFPNMKSINLCLFTIEETIIFATEFLNQSDKFDVFEYYGTPEEQGLSIFNSFCKVCKNTFSLENFSTSSNCCKGMCDFCYSKSAPVSICFACNEQLQFS